MIRFSKGRWYLASYLIRNCVIIDEDEIDPRGSPDRYIRTMALQGEEGPFRFAIGMGAILTRPNSSSCPVAHAGPKASLARHARLVHLVLSITKEIPHFPSLAELRKTPWGYHNSSNNLFK